MTFKDVQIGKLFTYFERERKVFIKLSDTTAFCLSDGQILKIHKNKGIDEVGGLQKPMISAMYAGRRVLLEEYGKQHIMVHDVVIVKTEYLSKGALQPERWGGAVVDKDELDIIVRRLNQAHEKAGKWLGLLKDSLSDSSDIEEG